MHRECRIHQYYNAGEQLSGLTSYYPGGTGGCHDGGHDTLITRSMELWGPVSLTYNAVGGKGTADSPGADENNITPGFMGGTPRSTIFARVFPPSLKEAAACTVALRRVSDGAYVGSTRHPCTGGCSGQKEQASFTNLGEAGVKYTVDVIDNYQGGWGWMLVNDFDIHQGRPDWMNIFSTAVLSREDSAEEIVSGTDQTPGDMYLTSSDLEFMVDGDTVQVIAIRFPSVDLDWQVDTAWILFDVDETEDRRARVDLTVGISGEKAVSSAPLSDTAFDVSGRTATDAMVMWNPATTDIVHEEMVTDDVSAIVNEITAQPGWAAGNPMTFIFQQVRGQGVRWVESDRNNNGVDTPGLYWAKDPCNANYGEPW